MKMKVFLIALGLVFALLLITNPSQKSFTNALPALTGLPNNYFTGDKIVSSFGRESNFILFSIYKVKVDHLNYGVHYYANSRYLGVMGNFYLIED